MPRIKKNIEEAVSTTAQTGTFTAEAESLYKLDLSSSDITVHLPTASGVGGQDIILAVVSSGDNHATIVPSGVETVGEINQLRLETHDTVWLTSDDLNNWIPVGAPLSTTAQAKRKAYGSLYVSTPGTTAVTGGAAAGKATCTTTLSLSNYFDMPTDNRLRYTGHHNTLFKVSGSGSVSINAATSLIHCYLYKNGSIIASSEVDVTVSDSNDHETFSINCYTTLTTNDYLELYVKSDKNGNLDVDHLMITAEELVEV